MIAENALSIIALMMNEIDAEFIAKHLKPHAPDAKFAHITSLDDLSRIAATKQRTRLLSFCSPLLVPEETLQALRYNAYNFHPGPPERPGYMPAPFALHEKTPDFGATFHRMLPKVDTGEIIDVQRFQIDLSWSQEQVEIEAYKALLGMVLKHAANLANTDFHFPGCGIAWSGKKTTRKDLAALPSFIGE